jgi:ActR/RegA family two-component response regulator
MSGMEVLERIINYDSNRDVVLITGHYSIHSAIEAIKKDAPITLPNLYRLR